MSAHKGVSAYGCPWSQSWCQIPWGLSLGVSHQMWVHWPRCGSSGRLVNKPSEQLAISSNLCIKVLNGKNRSLSVHIKSEPVASIQKGMRRHKPDQSVNASPHTPHSQLAPSSVSPHTRRWQAGVGGEKAAKFGPEDRRPRTLSGSGGTFLLQAPCRRPGGSTGEFGSLPIVGSFPLCCRECG